MAKITLNMLKLLLWSFNAVILLCAVFLIIIGVLALKETGKTDMTYDNVAVAVIPILTGAVTFIVTVLGCCGALHDSFAMLLGFNVGLSVLTLLEMTAIIMAAILVEDVDENLRQDMENAIVSYKTNSYKQAFWNLGQRRHKCCGIVDHEDWIRLNDWVPPSCCHRKFNGVSESEHPACAGTGEKNYLYTRGCYEPFKKALLTVTRAVIYVGIVACCVKFLGIGCGSWLSFRIKKLYGWGHH